MPSDTSNTLWKVGSFTCSQTPYFCPLLQVLRPFKPPSAAPGLLPNSPQTSGVEVDMLHTMSSIIDFKAMADAQSNDPPLEGGAQSITVSWILIPTCDATLLCDTPTGTPHPLVPPQFCRKVFDALHSLSHPGVQVTQRFVTSRYVWPGINKDIQDWMQTCLQCQRVKVH